MREKLAMSVEEASVYTGIGRNTLRKLISERKIPVLRIGRKILIRMETLDNFLRINDGRNLCSMAEAITVKN